MEKLLRPRLVGIALLFLGLPLAGCATDPSSRTEEYVGEAGTTGQVSGILLTQNVSQAGAPKVIVASYRVTAAGFTATQALVSFGSPGALGGGGDDYTVELVGQGGETLLKYGIWDDVTGYNRDRLKLINVPVLKSHHASYGVTAVVKNYMGVVSGALGTNSHGAIAYGILDRKSTRLNSSHSQQSRMPSSA